MLGVFRDCRLDVVRIVQDIPERGVEVKTSRRRDVQ